MSNVLKYGAKTVLKLDIPDSWDLANLTAIGVRCTDDNGSDLIGTSEAATLYTPTVLDSASAEWATSIVLPSTADDLVPGNKIMIGADTERKEIRQVISFDDTTNTVTLEELNYAHEDGAAVVGMFAEYELDLTDTAVFTLGKHITVRYTPDTSDLEYVESYEVGQTGFSPEGIWDEFKTLHSAEYDRLHSRDDFNAAKFEAIARRRMATEMRDKGMSIDKIQDMELLHDGLIDMMWFLSKEGMEDEAAEKAWLKSLDIISHLPIWQDADQDKAVDTEEVKVHGAFGWSYQVC